MAGGKETPRAKMIGMMYLVLTALLALQVSNAVLEKFAIINVTLSALKDETGSKNAATLRAIVAGAEGKTSEKVLLAVENAKKVRDLTTNTIKELEDLKQLFIQISGSTEVDEAVINDHSSKIATLMMDGRTPTGANFQKALDDYVTQLEGLSGLEFAPLAKAPADIPFFADDPDHNKKNFIEFTFENTPAIAALTSVTEIETELMEYETKALDKLAIDAEAGTIRFDKIVPMVRPKASIVAAGDFYEADMFITASAEGITPEMFRNGQALEVVADPVDGIMMGKVRFPASASNYNAQGLAEQEFEAEIRIGDSEDQIYKQTIKYFVAKPVIRVTTGNAPTLYMNCGNTVNIEVPALGTNYNPTFRPTGADVVKGDVPSKVTIIPKQREVTITVINGGATIGSEKFAVKNIPAPDYVAYDNANRPIDMKNGVAGAQLTGIRINAEADENFKTEVPNDAQYIVRQMEVIHARATQQIASMNVTTPTINLAQWRANFRPGDRIVIDIKTVTRRTFQGENEPVAIRSEVIQVTLR